MRTWYEAIEATGGSVEETSAQASSNHQANENKHLKIMSWNIDGLDDKSLTYRCSGIVRTLKKYYTFCIDYLMLICNLNWNQLKEIFFQREACYCFPSGGCCIILRSTQRYSPQRVLHHLWCWQLEHTHQTAAQVLLYAHIN